MDLTELSEEPTLNVPGLVTVNAPLENSQLSAVELFKMSMLVVPAPNVTEETVMSPFAVKSVVAVNASTGTNSATKTKSL